MLDGNQQRVTDVQTFPKFTCKYDILYLHHFIYLFIYLFPLIPLYSPLVHLHEGAAPP